MLILDSTAVFTHEPTHTHLFSTVASQGLQWVWKTEARKRTNIWVVDDSVAWLVLGTSVTHSLRLKWMFELGLSQILALPTCRIRCVIQFMPWAFIHENVTRFPEAFFEQHLSQMFDVEQIVLSPQQLGLPVSRTRRFTLCRRRSRVQKLALQVSVVF